MKKTTKLSYFLRGVICTLLVVCLTSGVLAATGTVKFSSVNVALNGQQVGAKGEYYTLANGESAPYSISYVDEQGGGTTYLPVRKVCELLGIDIQWDGSTGTANIVNKIPTDKIAEQKPEPKTYWKSLDYVKIQGKIYQLYPGVTILKDIPYNNDSFCAIAIRSSNSNRMYTDHLSAILALASGDYTISEDVKNPHLAGKIIPKLAEIDMEEIDGVSCTIEQYSTHTITSYSVYASETKKVDWVEIKTPNTTLSFSSEIPEEIGSVYISNGLRCYKYGKEMILSQFVSIDDICNALGFNLTYDFETIDGALVLVIK